MKIIFDLTKVQPIGNSKYHGGAKYGEYIFFSLITKTNNVIAFYNSKKYINPEVLAESQKRSLQLVDINNISITRLCKNVNGLIYSPLLDSKAIDSLDISSIYITTIHGLRRLECPTDIYEYKYHESFIERLKYKYLSKLATHRRIEKEREKMLSLLKKENVKFITVSEHSKASLLSFFAELNSKEINVFYSPLILSKHTIKENRYNQKYYLLISGNRWIKNIYRAMIAFDELFDEHPNWEGVVIITGIKKDSKLAKEMINKQRFIYLEYVDDDDLTQLYQNAFLFVYPTLNEGFGYPPLEAAYRGIPVIASAISAVPEICGDSVLYFNPYSISEIKMRIIQMENENIREYYIKKGFERYQLIAARQNKDLDAMIDMLIFESHNNK